MSNDISDKLRGKRREVDCKRSGSQLELTFLRVLVHTQKVTFLTHRQHRLWATEVSRTSGHFIISLLGDLLPCQPPEWPSPARTLVELTQCVALIRDIVHKCSSVDINAFATCFRRGSVLHYAIFQTATFSWISQTWRRSHGCILVVEKTLCILFTMIRNCKTALQLPCQPWVSYGN